MKTIICFDGWTQGVKHIEKIAPILNTIGYRLLLIHIGSWGHDIDRPNEERIGFLDVRDISFYKSMSFMQILQKENPKLVIFLSTRALAHQAFNIGCRYLNIPTLHLYHGLVTVQAGSSRTVPRAYKVNWYSKSYLIKTRWRKNVIKIWPAYIYMLFVTRAPLKEWIEFIREIPFKLSSNYSLAPRVASTTAGCVYVNSDVIHMASTYRVAADRIHTVGNPDLMDFGIKESDFGCWLEMIQQIHPDIIYIDTALTDAGVVYSDQDDFVHHLVETSAGLARHGLRLVVKLHPAHYRSEVPIRLQQLGIQLCGKEDFVKHLKTATAALVEPSTVAVIPGLLGMPLLLAEYGRLTGQRYGSVLESYPFAAVVRDLNEVSAILKASHRNIDRDDIAAWIKLNSGPMPAEDMPGRVVRVIADLANGSC
jgi:hypothetical protein